MFNGYLYFSVANATTSSTAAQQGRVLRIDLSNTSYTNTTILNTALTIIGGIPAGWELTNILINGYSGGKFYVTNVYLGETIVCTDLADISGTIVGCFDSGVYNFDIFSTTNKPEVFVGGITKSNLSGKYKAFNDMLNTTSYVDTRADDGKTNMVWISYGLYSNYWTLYPLSSPLDKTGEDTVEVLYKLSWQD